MWNEIKLFGVKMNWCMTIEDHKQKQEIFELLGKDFQVGIGAIDIILIPVVTGNLYGPQCYPKTIGEADEIASELLENTDHFNLFRMDSGLLSYLMCPLYRVICNRLRELCKYEKYPNFVSQSSQVFYQDNFNETIYNLVNVNMIWDFLHVYINIPINSPLTLVNNTVRCYMNCVIQCLYWTPGFVDTLLNKPQTHPNAEGSNIANDFINVMRSYHMGNNRDLKKTTLKLLIIIRNIGIVKL